jgi:hypothetical protein
MEESTASDRKIKGCHHVNLIQLAENNHR